MFSKIDETYTGRRVRLLYTDEKNTKLKPGDEGIYLFTTINPGLVEHSIKWDNGDPLVLVDGRDKFEFIEINQEGCGQQYHSSQT
jgi:hypothetical protein